MDSYDGTATLEWWGNPATCLGSFRVTLTVSVVSGDWKGIAMLDSPGSETDREGLEFLLQLDPVFTLRFADDSTTLVHVIAEGVSGCLILSAFDSGELAVSRTEMES
ncbi:hypothetical protein [Kitasatospora herbaricolor]|uniref:Uncharacterized protein n=1 Tax=Kitasatospora herbaricolor TaxID=68217 RepID=A0ABZ1WJV1_9ACTN|nr:hypothetical protein [Kitasatospora herbaricolor]